MSTQITKFAVGVTGKDFAAIAAEKLDGGGFEKEIVCGGVK